MQLTSSKVQITETHLQVLSIPCGTKCSKFVGPFGQNWGVFSQARFSLDSEQLPFLTYSCELQLIVENNINKV